MRVEFRANTVSPGDGHRLRPEDTLVFIRHAAELRIAVHEVAGLLVRSGVMVRTPEHIVQFSVEEKRRNRHWMDAEEFITLRLHLDLLFEVSLGEHLDSAR